MEFAVPGPSRREEPSQNFLESWKTIALYLRRDIRTLQRWERRRNLPIHRLPGGGKAPVYALKTELDAWRLGRIIRPQAERGNHHTVSIAVLPFANLSGSKRTGYFSGALVENIIIGLTHLPGLDVAARTSPMTADHTALCPTILLEGSVQISGSRVRVSAELVEAASGYHLWSERYDRELAGGFTAEDDIAKSVIQAVRLCLTSENDSREHH